MTMRIWNPSHFKIGEAGRSSCPQWQGRDFIFKPNETKEVSDKCGRWLISAFSYYGLVSLPDRNIVTDPVEYDKAVEKSGEHGIQNLYKWASRVVSQYQVEARKRIDDRERPPEVNNYVELAYMIQKKYHSDIQISDPEMIRKHNIQREIMGTIQHDSDKLLERALEGDIKDRADNARQYSNDPYVILDEKPNSPSEPTKPVVKTAEKKAAIAKKQVKSNVASMGTPNKIVAQPANSPQSENIAENLKAPINLDNSAI